MRTYASELESMNKLPRFYLGQEVVTPIGRGIIIRMEMPSNGLYLSPEKATAIVWFSTEAAQQGWVQKEFALDELKDIIIIDVGEMSTHEASAFMAEQMRLKTEAEKSI